MVDWVSLRSGVCDAALFVVPVVLFGVAFGSLAVEVGLAPWIAVLASVIVISASAQFVLVGLMAAGWAPVLIATTGLALRHVPMSVRLGQLVGPRRLRTRAGLAVILVDETFGLTLDASRRGVHDLVAYKTGADALLYGGWIVGTIAGVLLGGAVDPTAWGVDVLFPLLFLGLAAPLVRSRRDWIIAGSAVAAALVAAFVVPEAWQITGAASIGAAVGGLRG